MFQYVIDWTSLQERGKFRIQIKNRALLVCAIEGMAYTILDKCPHLGFPLSLGKFENGVIQCKEHALEINVKTGTVLNLQKADFLKLSEYDRFVRTFSTKVEDGKVYVDL
jgi:nitrite reductase/ring-hydroxylating ferredoxin subunit